MSAAGSWSMYSLNSAVVPRGCSKTHSQVQMFLLDIKVRQANCTPYVVTYLAMFVAPGCILADFFVGGWRFAVGGRWAGEESADVVDVDSSEEAGTGAVVWHMMAGTRDGTLILGEIGRGREDGATAAGGKRDSVLISGKTTEDSDAATSGWLQRGLYVHLWQSDRRMRRRQ